MRAGEPLGELRGIGVRSFGDERQERPRGDFPGLALADSRQKSFARRKAFPPFLQGRRAYPKHFRRIIQGMPPVYVRQCVAFESNIICHENIIAHIETVLKFHDYKILFTCFTYFTGKNFTCFTGNENVSY